jgi:GTP cyclohydrolase IA
MSVDRKKLMLNTYSNHDNLELLDERLSTPQFLESFDLGYPPIDQPRIEAAISEVLASVGEDAERPGLINTPRRVARAYAELLEGYRTDPVALINNALFDVDYADMVVVANIEFASLCEHHLLPFLGHVHVAYIPQGKVVGLSKIPRIVDMFARRLQLQEQLTRQIADFIDAVLHPQGVAVVIEGQHMCSLMRGVKKHDSSMTSSAMLGVFQENAATRQEFMQHLQRRASA